jgi:hypothetical protein
MRRQTQKHGRGQQATRCTVAFFLLMATWALELPSALAYPGRWNIGAAMGDIELLYGRFGDHEVYVGCSPSWNSMLMRIGLVAPASERRGRRSGIMIVTLGNREMRFSGQIENGRVEVQVPGSHIVDDLGREMVSVQSDPTRVLHVLWLDNDRRAEIDAFLEMLTTSPGAPMLVRIDGEPRTYQIEPHMRVRSARSVREACPATPLRS